MHELLSSKISLSPANSAPKPLRSLDMVDFKRAFVVSRTCRLASLPLEWCSDYKALDCWRKKFAVSLFSTLAIMMMSVHVCSSARPAVYAKTAWKERKILFIFFCWYCCIMHLKDRDSHFSLLLFRVKPDSWVYSSDLSNLGSGIWNLESFLPSDNNFFKPDRWAKETPKLLYKRENLRCCNGKENPVIMEWRFCPMSY